MSKKINSKIHPALLHLSMNEIEDVYKRYMNKEDITALCNKFNIDIPKHKFFSVFPPNIHTDIKCPYCDIPMISKRRCRSASSYRTEIICEECEHKHILPESQSFDYCTCDNCIEVELYGFIERHSFDTKAIVNYSELSLLDKIHLLSYLSIFIGSSEYQSFSISLLTPCILSPTEELDRFIIETLYKKNILKADTISTFVYAANRRNVYVDIDKLFLKPNVRNTNGQIVSTEEIYNQLKFDIQSYNNNCLLGSDIKDFLMKISHAEILRYIELQCSKFNLPFTARNALNAVLQEIFNMHSVSQVIFFSYIAIDNALQLVSNVNLNYTPTHASNTIPNKIKKLGKKYRDDKKPIHSFQRFQRDEGSITSRNFSKIVFGDELATFNTPILKLIEDNQKLYGSMEDMCDSNQSIIKCNHCGSSNNSVDQAESKLLLTCHACQELTVFVAIEPKF